MRMRVVFLALASVLTVVPVSATPQELATTAYPGVVVLATRFTHSPECQIKRLAADKFRSPLKYLNRALRTKPQVKILAVGSSSTVGVGASSPSATYVARLEPKLEAELKGIDFDVIGRGMSGEVAQGAADRMKKEVEDAKPDLVIWQVGTNDALRHVSLDKIKNCLKTTLAWLAEAKIDVILVNPQYGDALVKNAYFSDIVATIGEVARDAQVPLVDRFAAMRELQRERGDRFYLTADSLHMNDDGYRCMAEQLAHAILGGLAQGDMHQRQALFHP